ncbi:carbohydrate ABC transporter permease [Candidatus Aerophobetes bacterium]|uniref:Carbohydrate ABC transporter permease n=1 Tax=Aerophobetes bacterium TaxID=2030807 RepID=A0A523RQZ6_UNCAE|nr:MAG: carbohydrate ABC transporter permease [Candidatus Aerophobetes bacterium]
MKKFKGIKIVKRILLYLGVVTLVLFCLFPFLWMISSSFKTTFELYGAPPTYYPHKFTLASYIELFKGTFFARWFINTCIVAVGTTLLCILVASVAAYSLTRYKYPGRASFANFILVVYMFPPILLAIPLYLLVINWRIADTRWALILTYIANALPYSLWLLRAFFQTIPIELEDAAMIDGASRWRVIRSIVMPLALPGVIATSVFAIITSWNEYLFAMLFISSESKKTIPVGLTGFITAHEDRWDLIFSGSVMASIPVLIFFVYIQKFLIEAWGPEE